MTESARPLAGDTVTADRRPAAAGTSGAGRPDERQGTYREVACERCGAVVQAAKFSYQHTSVQWDAAAVRQCAEFTERLAGCERSALVERCQSMRDSIDAAALDGRLPVAAPEWQR
jgi:hypothetical protein